MEKIKVLVVDDNRLERILICGILNKNSCQCREACDGVEALDMLNEDSFDVIISDIMMPNMDGFELLKQLRKDKRSELASVPVIVNTGLNEKEDLEKALALGAMDYIQNEDHGILKTELPLKVRNLAALQQTRQELARAEKLSTLFLMSTGISHEIKNPIGFVLGNITFLEKLLNKMANVQGDLEALPEASRQTLGLLMTEVPGILSEMRSGAERIDAIVNNMTGEMADNPLSADTVVDLSACAASALASVNIPEQASKHQSLTEGADFVGSEIQIGQVLRNILNNALHELQHVSTQAIQVKTWGDDQSVYVGISDTGRGVPKSMQSKLFTPFYTSKEQGEGVGIGLWICQKIIAAHNGDIRIISPAGDWATEFRIRLPRAL